MASSGSGNGGDDSDGRDDHEHEEQDAEPSQSNNSGSPAVEERPPRTSKKVVPLRTSDLAPDQVFEADPEPETREPGPQPREADHVRVTAIIETTDQRVFRITESDLLAYARTFEEGVSRKYRPRGALWNAVSLLGIASGFGIALVTTTFKDAWMRSAFIACCAISGAFAAKQLWIAVSARFSRRTKEDPLPETPEELRDMIESKGNVYRVDRNGRTYLVRRRRTPRNK